MDIQTGLKFVQDYVDRVGGEFMAFDVRKWAEKNGCPVSIQPRVWGSVMIAAKKANIVQHVGYAPSDNISAHRTPASVWQAA